MHNLVLINIILGEFTYRYIKRTSDNNGQGYITSGFGDLEAAFFIQCLRKGITRVI